MPSRETDLYFGRFGFCDRQIAEPPPPDLGIAIVIPCFNEPDLIGSLESLRLCDRPNCSVEVIVVVNSPAGCSEEVRTRNQATLKAATEWTGLRREAALSFHLLHFPDLPAKQAGVGLARKIGMDEALRRFDEVGRLGGVIAGYDADCRCEPSYLAVIGTAVFPSARPSDRVPFGTGRAVRAFLEQAEMKSYPLEAFLDLQQLFGCLPRMYRDAATFEEAWAGHLPASIRGFLRQQRFA